MSTIKRHMEDMQGRQDSAVELCISAGVLERCEYCSSTVFHGGEDVSEAYDLGEAQLDSGDSAFSDYDDMVSAVDDAVADFPGDTCYHCDSVMNGD